MTLQPESQVRVTSSNEHGTLRAEIVPRADNEGFFVGGPFEIHVTGTSFDASWDSEQATLRVTIHAGHVTIHSECMPEDRVLAAGQSAMLACPVDRVKAPNAANAPSEPAIVSSAPIPSERAHVQSSALRDTPEPPLPSSEAASWREFARQGHYRQALAAAEVEDFDGVCVTLPESDLFELATAARLAGNAPRAKQAYSSLRSRFAGTDSAATAAFHLGQLAFDSSSSFVGARRWFTSYLNERPNEALAAEALGRIMEAEQRLGDPDAARATASLYLTRFPTGAHARLAESLKNP